ncbi:hypothetical protein MHYP_G00232390 [Metynnis hypsauchen]
MRSFRIQTQHQAFSELRSKAALRHLAADAGRPVTLIQHKTFIKNSINVASCKKENEEKTFIKNSTNLTCCKKDNEEK